MAWLWVLIAVSLAVGSFYSSYEVKKENEKLQERIQKLEAEVYK